MVVEIRGDTGKKTLYLQTSQKDDDCTKAYFQTLTWYIYDRHDWVVSRAAEPAHNWEEWSIVPSGTHSRTCSKDPAHVETRSCYGDTSTCQRKAVCTACSEEYGDYSAHNYGTLVSLQDAVHTPNVLKSRVEAHYPQRTAALTAPSLPCG